VIFVYTQRIRYSCILEASMSLYMNILVVVSVGYFGGNPNCMDTTTFFMGECRCEHIYILFRNNFNLLCFSISNSVYSERGKMKIREN
jgi:hypothetical protein